MTENEKSAPAPDTSAGHRKRLRERFLTAGLSGFQDYEIIELLLTLGAPRKDCKSQAKEALKKFKTLRGVLQSSPDDLQQIRGIGPHNVFGIKLVQEVTRAFLKEKILDQPVYESSQEIYDYLYQSMRDLKKEVFKVIYLDSQNHIIEAEDLFEGTVNASSIYPREIIRGAIKNNAASLIFVHNHPSGNAEPSASDRLLTRDLVYAGCVMQIKILDHIIIGSDRHFGFVADGLVAEYEMDFLNLKAKGMAAARRQRYVPTPPSKPG